MWKMIWPILMVVGANCFYNICAKSTPKDINAFASLAITYTVAAVLSVVMFWVTGAEKHLTYEMSKTNWTSVVLGAAIVALEFGNICIYRAGWKISIGSLVANISLACMLIIIGVLLYKEHISLRQVMGIGICMVGLFFITK